MSLLLSKRNELISDDIQHVYHYLEYIVSCLKCNWKVNCLWATGCILEGGRWSSSTCLAYSVLD